jgi:hypothetical protein
MEAEKLESLLEIFSFNSGVAWPANEAVSDEEVLETLQSNLLVGSCELYAEHHVHVKLKRVLTIGEIQALRISLRQEGVEFLQRKTPRCSRSLQPLLLLHV